MRFILSKTIARQLYQGLGRPALHLQRHDAAPYREALLYACVHNPVYDRQCEGSRADYLLGLLHLTGELPWYRRRLLDQLANPGEEDDLDQLLDFAVRFAREGDAEARLLLYERAIEQFDEDERTGATQLIDLDGLDGFVVVAERLGALASRDPDFAEDDWLRRYLLDDTDGAAITARLQALRRERPLLDRYLRVVEANDAHRTRLREDQPRLAWISYAELRALLLEDPRLGAPSTIRHWAEAATDNDLQVAAHALLDTTSIPLLLAHLMIFHRRPFPLPAEALFPLVRHDNERVGRAALTALAQLTDPTVRQLGLDLLSAEYRLADALVLFVRNYRPDDDRQFAALVAAAGEDDALHAISARLCDIYQANPSRAAAPLLLQLYERGPCSLCREDVVRQLIAIDHLPRWMAAECAHDANEGIRTLVVAADI